MSEGLGRFEQQVMREIGALQRRVEELELERPRLDEEAWRIAVSATLMLPGLRGLWTMGVFEGGANAIDLSGNGRTLTYNGNPKYRYDDLVPYLDFDGTGDYLARADEAGLDILGTESYVHSTVRGLSIGGLFYFDRATTLEYLICKWAGVGQQSYRLIKSAADAIVFRVQDPAGTDWTQGSTDTVATGEWYHAVGVFDPNTAVRIYLNNVKGENVAGAVASIRNSNADLRIGADGSAGNLLDGRASLCFLCAAMLSDDHVAAHFEQVRAAYGILE